MRPDFEVADVETLLAGGADVNGLCGMLRPLHCCCMASNSDGMALLINHGADVSNRLVIVIVTSIGTRSAFFSMKAAKLKCHNLIVKKVCQVEHLKTFRKAIGPELSL